MQNNELNSFKILKMSQHWSISLGDRNFYLLQSLKFSFFFLLKMQAIKTNTFSKEAEKIFFPTIFDPILNGKSYFHLNTFL